MVVVINSIHGIAESDEIGVDDGNLSSSSSSAAWEKRTRSNGARVSTEIQHVHRCDIAKGAHVVSDGRHPDDVVADDDDDDDDDDDGHGCIRGDTPAMGNLAFLE